ncbi:TetR/AcrR family transcriptional regulator [Petropleomorpha daqingensis]|uniref:AcrR family transcriptional regulator n=1 Tax=Petropleomorpha daqingensis TaxID=2026353 RepID=A0A853CJW8_9ACTN|nr:AcrR family transcriptional regulator [Petropleomorpha daqingensis]
MADVQPFVREPKQERSRQSFEKALDAAVALMVERRSGAFTLAEVAERAGVSIGSMYGRVDSKDDLIRSAHAREMARIRNEQEETFGTAAPADEDLPRLVRRIIVTTAEHLRRNAAVLAPLMVVGSQDPQVFAAGRQSYDGLVEGFCSALLTHRDEIRRADPDRAVAWSFDVVYSVVARYLGLGSAPEGALQGEWEKILDDLAEMVTAFLEGSTTR